MNQNTPQEEKKTLKHNELTLLQKFAFQAKQKSQ